MLILSCGTPEGMIECELCGNDYSDKSFKCVHCGEPNAKIIENLKRKLEAKKRQDMFLPSAHTNEANRKLYEKIKKENPKLYEKIE